MYQLDSKKNNVVLLGRAIFLREFMKITLGLFLLFGLSSVVYSQIDSTDIQTDSSLNIPNFSISLDDLEEEVSDQTTGGLLNSSRDVFSGVAGFNLSNGGFRLRGYNSRYQTISLNGIEVNSPELGYAKWSDWGGLNDITRYQESGVGITNSPYQFSGIGGYNKISFYAASVRKGTKLSYANSNRSYDHRIMLTHATGWMENGMYISASFSRRSAQEAFADGTYYDGMSYYLAIDKKLNDKHILSISGFGAPYVRAKASFSTLEAYELAGSNFYNSNWGYQNGEKRNSRVQTNHRPTIIVGDTWEMNSATKITSQVMYTFGKLGNTSLNWDDAEDPRPDYYRYLPSYYQLEDPEMFAQLTDSWMNDESARQIDWHGMYNANYKNLYTIENVNGTTESLTGNRSKYIVEDRINDLSRAIAQVNISHNVSDKLNVQGNFNYDHYTSRNYKVIDDLLGGDFWIDWDRFAEQEGGGKLDNDLNNTNAAITEGDVFGYDYSIHLRKASVFGQLNYTDTKFDAYLSLTGGMQNFWREGHMVNGNFPENSFGDSEKQSFGYYGVKAGFTYKINGRNFAYANVLSSAMPPLTNNAYLSPRLRHDVIDGLTTEKTTSADINYEMRYAKFRMRASAYYTQVNDQTVVRSFYHDVYNTFVNYIMTDVDHLFTGTELGLDYKITSELSVNSAIGISQSIYNSRPNATVIRDNSTEVLAENKTIYLQNYRLGTMPQTAGSVGMRYNAVKYWFVGANFNYFQDYYLDVNPDRRTEEAVAQYLDSDPQWNEILEQKTLDPQNTLDIFFGKSFKVKDHYIRLFGSVNNVLNNTDLVRFGFEQLRYDTQNIGKFPEKVSYAYGRTYFLMLTLQL